MQEGQARRFELVGYKNFKRVNPMSDHFEVKKFDHLEFFCGDATSVASRFCRGLGMTIIAKSDHSTGNHKYCSLVARSNDLVIVFTGPYSPSIPEASSSKTPHPQMSFERLVNFTTKHGLGVGAVGLQVADAEHAYRESVKNGAESAMKPVVLNSEDNEHVTIAEVKMYGDVVLRYISRSAGCKEEFLPLYERTKIIEQGEDDDEACTRLCYGIERLDHCVGNVPNLLETVNYIGGFTGFHEFAEFTAEDVGTIDSGLNSMVLASNNEMVLLPVNEPTFGTPRKSQIQTYLEQNEGAGVQHLALKCDDIFHTVGMMRKASSLYGFGFMPRPSPEYYQKVLDRVGKDSLSKEQIQECERLGILVDRDDQGVLLQLFTKPLGDRPTIFIEIIQRIGCMHTNEITQKQEQKGGCGGFGKGNFSELFKSIEEYEKSIIQ